MRVEVICSCGRLWLVINGVYVAMQGDKCRDPDVLKRATYEPERPEYGGRPGVEHEIWDIDTLYAAAKMIKESKE